MQQANIINSCVKIESFKKSMQKKKRKKNKQQIETIKQRARQ